VGFYIDQMVDGTPHRCFTTNLSSRGIFVEQVLATMDRRSHVVQLEVPLPGFRDALWTRGEVVYDRFDHLFHGTAIRFTGMAHKHRRMLRTWLRQASRDEHRGMVLSDGVWIQRPSRILTH
jgi:hypothetical protein